MNWLDLVILIIVGVSAAMGLKIGIIRATLTSLAVFVGSVLGVGYSHDIGGLLPGIDSDSAIATVISYGIIIALCLIIAAITSVILRKAVGALAMNWADKLAGVAVGLVAGAVISVGVVMAMANMTYSSGDGDSIAAKVLDNTLDTEMAKKRLEEGLNQSALVGILVDVIEIVPASTMRFLPSSFTHGLDVLGLRQPSVGD